MDEKAAPVDSGDETSSDTTSELSEKTSQTNSPMTMIPLEGSLIITGGALKVVFPDMKEKPLIIIDWNYPLLRFP